MDNKKVKFGRNWRHFNSNEFKNELTKLTWVDVSSPSVSTNTSMSIFYRKIEKLLDEMAPIKKLTAKEVGLTQRPWITPGILKSMSSRDKCYKEFLKEKNSESKTEKFAAYKLKRNLITSLLRTSKKNYYNTFFEENQTDIKRTWQGIRNLINVSKKANTNINKLIENGKPITDPKRMADIMNKFYANIGKSVEEKIPHGNKPFTDYLYNPNIYSIVLNPCDAEEIGKYIRDLNVSKACGPYSISTNILKTFSAQLIQPLTFIINKSLNEGVFPSLLKLASICPIYKKNDRTKSENYRPISLLSNISKIFERAMYNRIELFLNDFEIIYKLQFGFRKKMSTNHALLSITEEIRRNLDNKTFSCGVFVDLEKAFDTVNHKILTSKLEHYGIRDNANDWIKSYLNNRQQFVNINGSKSETKQVRCGVPQGSILGPLLFIIYINDMHKAVESSIMHHFADDTNLLFSSRYPKQINKILNRDLKLLFDWLCSNRLSLNAVKTEFIVFRPPRKNINNRIVLRLNGLNIYESPKIKYLGIILDARLCWKHHIHELSKKLNRAVGLIYKIREFCTPQVLRSLYFSLFYSHLTYCISVWGKSDDTYMHKLKLAQKQIVRALTFSEYRTPSKPLLKELAFLDLDDLYGYQIASIMWDYDHGNLPTTLSTLFKRREDTHNRNLRNTKNHQLYTAHRYNNRHGYNSFSQHGALILNELKGIPFYCEAKSKKIFLNQYKNTILESY